MRRDLKDRVKPDDEDVAVARALLRVADAVLRGAVAFTPEQRRTLKRLLTLPGSDVAAHATTREEPGLF